MIKEVIFFCYGDSRHPRSWSNIPFLFSSELERKGVIVHRVSLSPNPILEKIYNSTVWRIRRFFHHFNEYNFLRTDLNIRLTYRIVKKAVLKYCGSDYCIFTNYDYWNPFNSIPSVLFSDWTYKIQISERKHLPLRRYDLRYVRYQDRVMSHAGFVVSLFGEAAVKMKKNNPSANIVSLERNVINNMYGKPLDAGSIIQRKSRSASILFIGRSYYWKGAVRLLEAYRLLSEKCPDATLEMVGLDRPDDFEEIPGVRFHGYLDKADETQRELYYDLILNARLIVNPTPGWAGYSSVTEAMYFYTPVVISPFAEFVREFGSDIRFGSYFDGNEAADLASVILGFFDNENYEQTCRESHLAVKDNTWSNYLDVFLKLIAINNRLA